ncbi:lipase family alpha/beta hydrolase [Nocardia sp. CDC160]|uniref:lipase family alpha/beta hydrolase n=1 Tax=Nocardia sp. CDC160 TaxID=3112166 RepID=UPI002DBD52C9|nr:alpha/beta hydrolase [Nocardia sp. CDC160]MEC3919993.1 alpha/beta hydrolase [Nocardia sp. CDC160]
MALPGFPHPSGVADYDDRRRRERLRATRLGAGWVRLRRTRLIILRLSLIPLVALGAFAEYMGVDVLPEQARLARTEPAVLPIAGPSDAKAGDTAVFDLVGLGVLDAGDTARALPSLTTLGSVWAVRYDQTGIDTKVISDLIVKVTEAAKVPNVVLVGHSMGGVIALEIAKHLHVGSAEKVRAVILDCTPVDLDAVRPESRDQGEEMLRWMGWFPGARESRLLRLIVETYARHQDFVGGRYVIRGDEFRQAVRNVLRDKILNTNAASNGLIEAQFKAIVAGGAIDDLRALSKPAAGKPRPAIAFIRPHNPYDDPIVNVEYSHKVLIDQVGGVDGTLLVVTTHTTGHANPIERPQEYNAVIANQIVPFVRQVQQDEIGTVSVGR